MLIPLHNMSYISIWLCNVAFNPLLTSWPTSLSDISWDLTVHFRAYVCVLTGVHAKGKKATFPSWHGSTTYIHSHAHIHTHMHRQAYAPSEDIPSEHTQIHMRQPFNIWLSFKKKLLSSLTGGVIEKKWCDQFDLKYEGCSGFFFGSTNCFFTPSFLSQQIDICKWLQILALLEVCAV